MRFSCATPQRVTAVNQYSARAPRSVLVGAAGRRRGRFLGLYGWCSRCGWRVTFYRGRFLAVARLTTLLVRCAVFFVRGVAQHHRRHHRGHAAGEKQRAREYADRNNYSVRFHDGKELSPTRLRATISHGIADPLPGDITCRALLIHLVTHRTAQRHGAAFDVQRHEAASARGVFAAHDTRVGRSRGIGGVHWSLG